MSTSPCEHPNVQEDMRDPSDWEADGVCLDCGDHVKKWWPETQDEADELGVKMNEATPWQPANYEDDVEEPPHPDELPAPKRLNYLGSSE